jgi:hypothetical protein
MPKHKLNEFEHESKGSKRCKKTLSSYSIVNNNVEEFRQFLIHMYAMWYFKDVMVVLKTDKLDKTESPWEYDGLTASVESATDCDLYQGLLHNEFEKKN